MHKCFKFTNLPLCVNQFFIHVVIGKLFNISPFSHFLALYHVTLDVKLYPELRINSERSYSYNNKPRSSQ
jgi:hypothetical protein